ncbi:hypothetical protein PsorP6_007966 [Peronosclerospora sorghi]|uniref:Uncharacterized protein n=1 Tax=Peronosclerospora sorghi TaxID=230839 RepID=A0ACC0WA11_9STRA|nr:hypothetical protein PsorP6_007966 [Peronosclerospora sorghi]
MLLVPRSEEDVAGRSWSVGSSLGMDREEGEGDVVDSFRFEVVRDVVVVVVGPLVTTSSSLILCALVALPRSVVGTGTVVVSLVLVMDVVVEIVGGGVLLVDRVVLLLDRVVCTVETVDLVVVVVVTTLSGLGSVDRVPFVVPGAACRTELMWPFVLSTCRPRDGK